MLANGNLGDDSAAPAHCHTWSFCDGCSCTSCPRGFTRYATTDSLRLRTFDWALFSAHIRCWRQTPSRRSRKAPPLRRAEDMARVSALANRSGHHAMPRLPDRRHVAAASHDNHSPCDPRHLMTRPSATTAEFTSVRVSCAAATHRCARRAISTPLQRRRRPQHVCKRRPEPRGSGARPGSTTLSASASTAADAANSP